MNSLDKMEDYGRLKQERDELAAQVEVMREALLEAKSWNWLDDDLPPDEVLYEVDRALSLPSSAALREIQARTLEEAAGKFNEHNCRGLSQAMKIILSEMAAAKRKGE